MKYKVKLHSEENEYIVEIDDYNAQSYADKINDNENGHTIALGDMVFSKIDIKSIRPLD